MSSYPVDPDTLLAYADGDLDAARRAEVEALLAESRELRAEFRQVQLLQRGLRDTFSVVGHLPGLGEGVWKDIA